MRFLTGCMRPEDMIDGVQGAVQVVKELEDFRRESGFYGPMNRDSLIDAPEEQ